MSSSHSQTFTPEGWAARLQEAVWSPEVEIRVRQALCLYLADLGLFEVVSEQEWRLIGFDGPVEDEEAVRKYLKKRVSELACTDAGFALVYFLNDPPDRPEPEFLRMEEPPPSARSKGLFPREKKIPPKGSADPSNLQIVKKVGRQMGSYIALEKEFIDRVVGTHTTRAEARKIFNAALAKIRSKAKPQSWEQISRRRHK
ncbi:hypothetical protein [Nitrospina gracilis]|uniref:hypothetical protein n=1 Tax=Nitrospina gracilis TaxID=35801 RepID=UPI001F25CCB5|nr:hypothetical protein [Nitrospina gracilis]MCF8720538.1 hypothetical protein [Nitrospina gracilis Nb-211]